MGCVNAQCDGQIQKRVLVVGGSPEPSSAELVRLLSNEADILVAVDHGLDVLLDSGLGCDLFCGDADSVSERGRDLVRRAEQGVVQSDGLAGVCMEVERYDPHKDFTDLSLALRAIRARWACSDLICTCMTGGRPDHALAVMGRLASWENGEVRIEEDNFQGAILRSGSIVRYSDYQGDTFSFIPLSPEATVSEFGMRWELDHARVPLLSDLGISNVVESADACIICHEGLIATWLYTKR